MVQNIIVIAIVILCAGLLFRHFRRSFRSKSCSCCPATGEAVCRCGCGERKN